MPEMPEVETIVRELRKKVIDKRISRVHLSGYPLRKPIEKDFAGKLRGRALKKIVRRGKYIIVELEPKAFWVIHLGMSGKVLYHDGLCRKAKHTHVIVQFSDSTKLEYRDPRRFGLMAVHDVSELNEVPEIRSLGRDPLGPDFNDEWLLSELQKSRQEIKAFLLNQKYIAGLGNIYACEALFMAGISPRRRCLTLARGEASILANGIREVMRNAITRRGTSFSDFVDSEGKPGENQNHLAVFQREGEACIRCRRPIRRVTQANRSTFYCGKCQK